MSKRHCYAHAVFTSLISLRRAHYSRAPCDASPGVKHIRIFRVSSVFREGRTRCGRPSLRSHLQLQLRRGERGEEHCGEQGDLSRRAYGESAKTEEARIGRSASSIAPSSSAGRGVTLS